MIGTEKKTICMIGAFPPPINGQAVAFETLSNSSCGISSSNQGTTRDWHIAKTIEHELRRAKFIIHHHGGNFRTFYESTDDEHRKMVDSYLRSVDRAIVLTPKLRNLFKGLLPDEKVSVVSNGISLSDLLPDEVVSNIIEQLKQSKTLRILFLSNLIRTKGFFELLRTAPLLLKEGVDFHITFAGLFRISADELAFKNFVSDNKLESNVHFQGLVVGEEKRRLLAENNIFVLPTSYPNEGQPISILEAMSAGMAVATTDHGGITDVVKDGVNGIILSSTTPAAIANTVLQLNNNRELLVNICKENRRTAKEKYLERHFVQNMIGVFSKVLEDGSCD